MKPDTRVQDTCALLDLPESYARILLHTLGIQKRGNKWSRGGWRNRYCTGPEADTFAACQALTSGGWMQGVVNPLCETSEAWTFWVTAAGRAALRCAGWAIDASEETR